MLLELLVAASLPIRIASLAPPVRVPSGPPAAIRLAPSGGDANGLRELRTRSFQVVSGAESSVLARAIGARAEWTRSLLERELVPRVEGAFCCPGPAVPDRALPEPTTIRLHRDLKSLREATGAGTSSWSAAERTIHVAAVPGAAAQRDLLQQVQGLVALEFLDRELDSAEMPDWFREGLRGALALLRLDAGEWKLSPKALDSAKALLARRPEPALGDVLESGDGPNDLAAADTAVLAASFMLYLRTLSGAGPREFLREWKRSRDGDLATRAAFAGQDLRRIEDGWRAFVLARG